MIPVQGVSGQKIAVLGLARSGLAAARALQAGGAHVVVWDDGPKGQALAEQEGLELCDLTLARNMSGLASLIVSPGIAHLYPKAHTAIQHAWAAGVPVDNDIGLFFRSFATQDWDGFERIPQVVAITGSNGKSTTSALVHHILSQTGRTCQLAGNIGRGVLDLEPAHDGEVVVLELSSYQIELARALTPDVAVFANFSEDHLERHAGIGGYFAAKRRLFSEGGADRALIGIDEAEGQYLANQLAHSPEDDRVIRMSVCHKLDQFGWSIFAKKGFLSEYRKGRQVGSIDLRKVQGLPGAHNHQNACAAYGVCRSLGLAPRVIEEALHSFQGLAHRSELIGEYAGVRYINDSKATNVDAAAKALQAFVNIRWICGGLQKEGGLDALLPVMGAVRKAYVIGRDANDFARQLCEVDVQVCTDMATAVEAASGQAQAGDTVLLAPAAASFDQYDSFEARGEDFRAHVQKVADV